MKKMLVVYYSWSNGNTKRIAEQLAAATNADIARIDTAQPYSGSHEEVVEQGQREVEAGFMPQIKPLSVSIADYDVIAIGYPIWWGIAAWPVDNFVKGNDFTGKTVIPFCTSSSSGLGDSGNLLEEMAGTGDWQEGHRFSSGASDADAADWVASLNLNK